MEICIGESLIKHTVPRGNKGGVTIFVFEFVFPFLYVFVSMIVCAFLVALESKLGDT